MNWKLSLSYDGLYFSGWEGDGNRLFVKNELLKAIQKLFNETPQITCAGRTDAGVNAKNQVCSFSVITNRTPDETLKGLNFFLPHYIKILKAETVDANFSARFSAKYRIYRYFLSDKYIPYLNNKYLFFPNKINLEKIQEAMNTLIGKLFDISLFCPTKYPGKRLRSLESANIWKEENLGSDFTVFQFKSKAFAHNQIRSMVGSLLKIGEEKWDLDYFNEILEQKDRRKGGPLMPPYALFLWDVIY